MRTVFMLLLACAACEPADTRLVAESDLAPRTPAQTSLGAAPPDAGSVFQCLQDDAGRVRLTGILSQRIRTVPGPPPRQDTVVVVETPMRTVDCKNRAGGQPPPMLEPRSPVVLRGAGPAVRSFAGDTVVVFGEAPARGALLDAEPLTMRLDSLRIISAGQRLRVAASGAPFP